MSFLRDLAAAHNNTQNNIPENTQQCETSTRQKLHRILDWNRKLLQIVAANFISIAAI